MPNLEPLGSSEPARTPRPNVSKRHHYLAEAYLLGFAREDGSVAVHDGLKDTLIRQLPDATTVISQLNTLWGPDGGRRLELESELSEIEGRAMAVIKAIQDERPLNQGERDELSAFVGISLTRTPDGIAALHAVASRLALLETGSPYSTLEKMKRLVRAVNDDQVFEDEVHFVAQIMLKHTEAETPGGRLPPRHLVLLAYIAGRSIGRQVVGRCWNLVRPRSTEASFVTSDAPVCVLAAEPGRTGTDGASLWDEGSRVLLPLTASWLLEIQGPGASLNYRQVDDAEVGELNLTLARNRKQYLIGRDDQLVGSLASDKSVKGLEYVPKLGLLRSRSPR